MDAAAKSGRNPVRKHQIYPRVGRMSRLTKDGTAEPVSRDKILWLERGQENIHFPYRQPCLIDPYSDTSDDPTCTVCEGIGSSLASIISAV